MNPLTEVIVQVLGSLAAGGEGGAIVDMQFPGQAPLAKAWRKAFM